MTLSLSVTFETRHVSDSSAKLLVLMLLASFSPPCHVTDTVISSRSKVLFVTVTLVVV